MAQHTCPNCHQPGLNAHCGDDHPTCRWLRCSACRALIDLANLRAVDRNGKPVKL